VFTSWALTTVAIVTIAIIRDNDFVNFISMDNDYQQKDSVGTESDDCPC
jgi:hypothetical protein